VETNRVTTRRLIICRASVYLCTHWSK